jgi:hypothetical protein
LSESSDYAVIQSVLTWSKYSQARNPDPFISIDQDKAGGGYEVTAKRIRQEMSKRVTDIHE